MKEEDFPKEATPDNIADLIEKEQKIYNLMPRWAREKSVKGFLMDTVLDLILFLLLTYGFYFAFAAVFLLILAGLIYLFPASVFWTVSPEYYYPAYALVFLIIICAFLSAFRVKKRLRRWYSYKFLHFPRPEFIILSRGVLIAKNLLDGNRRRTKNFVRPFGAAVKKYLDENQDLRSHLDPETKHLQRSYLLRRMVLYSKNPELPYIFVNIGLSLIHEDFSRVFPLVGKLRTEMEKFEVRGKTERVMGFVERYMEPIRNLFYVMLVLMLLLIWLLKGYIPLGFP